MNYEGEGESALIRRGSLRISGCSLSLCGIVSKLDRKRTTTLVNDDMRREGRIYLMSINFCFCFVVPANEMGFLLNPVFTSRVG